MQKYYDIDQTRRDFSRFSSPRSVMPRIEFSARMQSLGVLKLLNSSLQGLDQQAQKRNRLLYGMNGCIFYLSTKDCFKLAVESPFIFCICTFIALACFIELFSFIHDGVAVLDPSIFWPIVLVVVGLLSIVTSLKVKRIIHSDIVSSMRTMVESTYRVRRGNDEIVTVGFFDLLVGDLILLTKDEYVPADVRIIDSDDFSVDQHIYTDDDTPVEKNSFSYYGPLRSMTRCTNVALAGARVVSGTAAAIVVAHGVDAACNALLLESYNNVL